MDAEQLRDELRRMGRSTQWLAEQIGYHPATIYNALSRNKFPDKLGSAISKFFAQLKAGEGSQLQRYSESERALIRELAAKEGFQDPELWVVSKIRGLLAMLSGPPAE